MAGIDLMRGIAAFGVVCIHTGLVIDGRIVPAAARLPIFFGFAVPFFLMTAFFFALKGERATSLSWRAWFTKRATRLLLPYAAWSCVYCLLRCAKFLLAHDTQRLREILHDPLALVFFSGGGSIALYFLPLLLVGLALLHSLYRVLDRLGAPQLFLLLIITTVMQVWIAMTGNTYNLADSQAFKVMLPAANQLILARFCLVLIAHALTCLPLILAAVLADKLLSRSPCRPQHKSSFQRFFLLWFLLFCLLSLPSLSGLPLISYGRGVVTFVLAWYISGLLKPRPWIATLGNYSFGVYLVHQLALQVGELLTKRFHIPRQPLGVLEFFAVASVIYFISLSLVALAQTRAPLVRHLFGLA